MKKDFFKKKPVIITAAVVLALAVICGGLAALVNPGSCIAKGISVGGINVSGLTIEEAEAKLSSADMPNQEIVLKTEDGNKTSLSGADIELKRDAAATVEKAYAEGRSENPFKNALRLLSLYFNPEDMQFSYTFNEENLKTIIYDFGVSVNGNLFDYLIDFVDDSIIVRKGIAGQSQDVSEALETVKNSLLNEQYEVVVELKKDFPPEPSVDSLYDAIYIEPKDASYQIADGKVQMFPEILGRQIDKIEAGTKIEDLKNNQAITLKLVTLVPDVTLAKLNEQLFNHVMGTYTTSYATSSRNRAANVALAASKINGVILAPDEVFSYNDIVGERSRANGFLEAPVFENGETVQGIGGGVCQVSSTLYSAVLYADLDIVTRQNHSMTVAYVPKGQDATVAYGSIDFKFKNNTTFPIKIEAVTDGKNIRVSVLGTKPEKEKTVKIVHNVIGTTAPTITETPDNTLEVGKKKVISSGKTGYTVETTRTVYENGTEVRTEKVAKSVYKMVPSKVAIGSKVPAPLQPLPPREPTPTPVPTPIPAPEEPATEPVTEVLAE